MEDWGGILSLWKKKKVLKAKYNVARDGWESKMLTTAIWLNGRASLQLRMLSRKITDFELNRREDFFFFFFLAGCLDI